MLQMTERDWRKTTLGARVRHAVERSKAGSNNAFAKAAGIASGPFSRIINDQSTGKVHRSPTLLAAIARAGGVSLHWLSTGEGQPEERHHEAPSVAAGPDRYPSRRAEAEALRGLVSDSAINAMLVEEHKGAPETDPGAEHWFARDLLSTSAPFRSWVKP